MTPWQLAAVGNEASNQRALFSWANIAERWGFAAAWDALSYGPIEYVKRVYGEAEHFAPNEVIDTGPAHVDELRWLHAIPNGDKREMITAANLKAQGVKKGICDTLLPLPMLAVCQAPPIGRAILYCGLYVELKRPGTTKAGKLKATIVDQSAGALSPEQAAFVAYAVRVGYAVYLAFDWEQAARAIQSYIEACRKNA